jgi:DNA-binding response OmpR family regulator
MPAVLIVDDDPDLRGMLAFTLADQGFVVREARDGEEALAALADDPPDCMVLDLMMPRVDGFEVLERMRSQGIAWQTRVMILTCKFDENSFVRGWELGADEYLLKPADPDVVAGKLFDLCGVKR